MNNNLTPYQFLNNYDKQEFLNAIEELKENNIIFEGQFSFLDDATMRSPRYQTIIEVLQYYILQKPYHFILGNN